MTARFWSGVPPRTASRLPKSSVDATPARVSRVRKTLSMLPGARKTSSGVTGVADGRSCTAISDTTCTVSANVAGNSRTSTAVLSADRSISTAVSR